MDLSHFSEVNLARCKEWMGEEDTLEHHVIGLAGEVGELCNEVKKLQRGQRAGGKLELPKDRIADELADVLIYLDLVAQHFGIDLGEATIRKFNSTSEKYGFSHRL